MGIATLLGAASLAAAAFAAPAVYKIEPAQLSPGNTYTLTVTQEKCLEGDTGATMQTAVLTANVTGVSVSPRQPGTLGCAAAWAVEVGASAPIAPTVLQLLDKPGGSVIALLKVDIIPVAGPIPPGLERQVDVMWKVLPYRAVADSFGKKVASQYFGIQIIIGNNSGYPVQFTSVGFRRTKENAPIPNDPYNFPRSTIEREQQVGNRALIRHGIEAASGLAAGASGLVGPRAKDDYALGLALSNPLTLGFDMVWPDKTVRHLIAMDTRGFRDGIIVANNVPSSPLVTFLSREMVECKGKGPCDEGKASGARLMRRTKDFDPGEIMKKLGELVLTGQQIQYLPRVSVAGNRVTPAPVPPVVSPLGSDREVKQGAQGHVLKIPGNGLTNGDVTPGAGSGITVKSKTVDAHGTSITVSLDVSDDAPVGESIFAVSTGVSPSQIVPVKVVAAAPVINSITPANAAQAGQTSVKLTVDGRFLKGATFQSGDTKLESVAKDGGKFEVTMSLDPLSAPKKFPVKAIRNGLESKAAEFELTPSKPEVETPVPAKVKKEGTTAPVEIKVLGNYLSDVKAVPAAESGLKITNVSASAATGQSKRQQLSFLADVKDAKKGKWKIALDNQGQKTEIEIEVE